MLYFTFNSDAVAVFVAHNLQQGEWVAQLPFFPGIEGDAALDERACASAIRACIGGEVTLTLTLTPHPHPHPSPSPSP